MKRLAVSLLFLTACSAAAEDCRVKDRCPPGWRKIAVRTYCAEGVDPVYVCASPDSKVEEAK